MQNTFFTADQHLDHARIIEHTNRPHRSVQDMNEALIEAWNKKVKRNDTVYHLGDLCWSARSIGEHLKRLNGQIILVQGNHDMLNSSIRKNFLTVVPYREIKVAGRVIVLFHYPIEGWNKKMHGSLHFHGHEHGNMGRPITKRNRVDVGVDCAPDYAPYHLDELLALCDE